MLWLRVMGLFPRWLWRRDNGPVRRGQAHGIRLSAGLSVGAGPNENRHARRHLPRFQGKRP